MFEACLVLTIKLRNTPYMYLEVMNIHTRYSHLLPLKSMKSYWKRYLPTYPFWYHFAKRYWRFWIKKMGDFFMLENRNSQQSCKVYLTKATSYFIRFMYVPVLGKTSSFLVFIFFETPRKTFFRSISIKELSKIYIYKNDNFFDPFSRSYLINLWYVSVLFFEMIWYFYRIKDLHFE